MENPIYFISDVHLGADTYEAEETKRNRLLSFLRSLRGQTPLLYIVGDLFDFMFRSNTRNLRIVKKHLDKHHPGSKVIEQ